jgi:hypothetical protein
VVHAVLRGELLEEGGDLGVASLGEQLRMERRGALLEVEQPDRTSPSVRSA